MLLFFGIRFSNPSDYKLVAGIAFVLLGGLISILLYVMYFRLREKGKQAQLKEKVERLEAKLKKIKKDKKQPGYLANVSREIRIPLSTISGMIHMLKNTDLDLDQQAQVEIAEYSTEYLLQLVNMMFNNSNDIDSNLKLENAPINLRADLEKLFKLFEYQAWEKGVDFEYRFVGSYKRDFLLLGDISKIQQVLINLLNNAVKFTNTGKVEVTIDHTPTNDDLQVVTFYVKDTGVGMNGFIQEKVINTLRGKLNATDAKDDNFGIGLAVAKKLVSLMGGNLKFESKENAGSAFYFSLQLKKTLAVITKAHDRSPLSLSKFDYKFNVLVAEDNKMNQRVIKFLLEQYGAECTFVTNGLDAINIYKAINYDIIFMDIYMPNIDGYEATKRIKATEKYSKRNIPIIAVSASAFKDDINKAKEAGVDDFLPKPIDNTALKSVLEKYVLYKEEHVS
ncbi:MAG: response regulator [Jejuia sp.]